MSGILAILILILFALALPPAIKKRSLPWFFASLGLSFLIVVLPLFIFLLSAFLTPDAKDECTHGWLDCFIEGKLMMLPLALLATAALYAIEVARVENRNQIWIVSGICSGVIVSVVCTIAGLVCYMGHSLRIFLLVPIYVSVWYSIRAIQLVRNTSFGPKVLQGTFLGSLLFLIGGIIASQSAYASLPDTQSGCFVVTAAGRGHRRIVGPFFEIQRHGRRFQANRQLIALWELETFWHDRSPRSHACFRRFYNRIGPVVARQIRSPWMADLAYAAIKPVELLARLVVAKWGEKQEPKTERVWFKRRARSDAPYRPQLQTQSFLKRDTSNEN